MPRGSLDVAPAADELDLAEATPTVLGARIRAARTQRSLSLGDLASAAQVSRSLISQIERGIATPSIETLRRLASAIGVPVFSLFLDEQNHQNIVRAADRRVVHYPGSAVTREILSPNLRGRMAVLWVTFPPGEQSSLQSVRHVGEECVVIVAGTLEIVIGDRPIRLEKGDSMTFDSEAPHLFRNPTDAPVEAFVVISPPDL
jgi:transcriptional regulator with XRE-family HTH domain